MGNVLWYVWVMLVWYVLVLSVDMMYVVIVFLSVGCGMLNIVVLWMCGSVNSMFLILVGFM